MVLPRCQPLRLAHTPDMEGHHATLAMKALSADRTEEMRPIPTPAVPTGQEDSLLRIEDAPVAVMPRLALGKCRGLEISLDNTQSEPDLVRHRIQGPALPMIRPNLLVAGHPLGPSKGGKGHRPGRRPLWRERHG
jgi:hypothetical protein